MDNNKKILITGSAGYIGSCLRAYLEKKFKVYALDKNKQKNFIKKNKKNFFICNLHNKRKLEKILSLIKPDVIVHLAGQSTVNENIKKNKYYLDNVQATRNIIELMKKLNIKNIIFSSTAAVYAPKKNKIKEIDKLGPISSYGKTKLKVERLLNKNKNIKHIILRFFNVSSCLTKPLVGEFHNPETHLIPISVFKALKGDKINIFGKDYPTKDGTCVRDYIHVKDICIAIHKSINFFKKKQNLTINIGNGKGITNREILLNLKKILKKKINYKFMQKRKGDHPYLICNISKAKRKINWEPKYSKVINILNDEIKWSKYLIKNKFIRKFANVQK